MNVNITIGSANKSNEPSWLSETTRENKSKANCSESSSADRFPQEIFRKLNTNHARRVIDLVDQRFSDRSGGRDQDKIITKSELQRGLNYLREFHPRLVRTGELMLRYFDQLASLRKDVDQNRQNELSFKDIKALEMNGGGQRDQKTQSSSEVKVKISLETFG